MKLQHILGDYGEKAETKEEIELADMMFIFEEVLMSKQKKHDIEWIVKKNPFVNLNDIPKVVYHGKFDFNNNEDYKIDNIKDMYNNNLVTIQVLKKITMEKLVKEHITPKLNEVINSKKLNRERNIKLAKIERKEKKSTKKYV